MAETPFRNRIVGTGEEDPEQLLANPKNWRGHPRYQAETLEAVLVEVGWVDDVIVNRSTGFVLDGHLRIALAMQHGERSLPVKYVELTAEEEEMVLATFDPISAMAFTDHGKLAELVADLRPTTAAMAAVVEAMKVNLTATAPRGHGPTLGERSASSLYRQPGQIDPILCISAMELAIIGSAALTGWQVGFNSTGVDLGQYQWVPPRLRKSVTFVDINWREYDHERHLAWVAEVRPKYATVRDLLREDDAERLGLRYYTLDETLRMAEEVEAAGAEHALLIPKYDCLAELPADAVLGYSVPSRYGGTELPLSLFAERKVHLLGGPWRMQRQAIEALGDAVVSFDNNHLQKMARYGQYVDGEGIAHEVEPLTGKVASPFMVAIVLSLSMILRGLREMGAAVAQLAEGVPDGPEPPDRPW